MGAVKISKPLSASMVSEYWDDQYTSSKERYYSDKGKVQGEWFGQMAADRFGLSGGVSKEAFDRLTQGQDPETGEQHVRYVTRASALRGDELDHRAAFDFTFAPHKTVSAAALVGGDDRILAAHDASLKVAMLAAETYTQARVSGNRSVTTGNLCAAIFRHETTRPVNGVPDPHLHSHVVVFNMTNDDGKIRAIQPEEWYRLQRYLDSIYQSEMAVRLQGLGYELERSRDLRYAAIAGYDHQYITQISRRTTQIEERKKELDRYGAKADHIIAHQGREKKVDWSLEQLQNYHVALSREMGQDPFAIPELAKARGYHRWEPQNADAALTFAKHTLLERNAVFEEYELFEQALRYGLGTLRDRDVRAAFDRRSGEFVETYHYREQAPGHRYTTPEMMKLEEDIIRTAISGKDTCVAFAPHITQDEFRQAYSDRLNNQQMWLSWRVLKSENRVMVIQGGAGVGKTTVLDPTRELIERHGYEVFGVAPTSRAASELMEAGITNSQTIQRYLAFLPEPGDRARVLFLDESSLASTAQVHRLLASMRPQDRLILCGDIRQHQSVEAGRIFEQLQQAGIEPFFLNKIMRQQDAPDLLEAVKLFSKGDVDGGLQRFREHGWIAEYPGEKSRYRAIATEYAASPFTSIAVTPDNDSRYALSQAIRTALKESFVVEENGYRVDILRNRQDMTNVSLRYSFSYQLGDVIRFPKRNKQLGVDAGSYAKVVDLDRAANLLTVEQEGRQFTYSPKEVKGISVFAKEEREFSVGDRLMFTRPWREKRVDNRDFGDITYLDSAGNVRVKLHKDNGRTVSFNLSQMPHLDYGYAVTSYMIQGGSKEHVYANVAAEDTRVSSMLDKVFANVAISRAKLKCRLFCDNEQALGPVLNKLHLKPKAHSLEQTKDLAAQFEHERTAALAN